MEGLAAQLQAAKVDLAFALAQGDGYAEDDAAARIAAIEALIKMEEATAWVFSGAQHTDG